MQLATTQKEIKDVMLSDANQKERDKYIIISLIYGT